MQTIAAGTKVTMVLEVHDKVQEPPSSGSRCIRCLPGCHSCCLQATQISVSFHTQDASFNVSCNSLHCKHRCSTGATRWLLSGYVLGIDAPSTYDQREADVLILNTRGSCFGVLILAISREPFSYMAPAGSRSDLAWSQVQGLPASQSTPAQHPRCC